MCKWKQKNYINKKIRQNSKIKLNRTLTLQKTLKTTY